jgi:putative FmdB family regulatory protein
MPIFEYTCNACNEMFAILQSVAEVNDTLCPKCGSNNIKKVPSSFSCSSDSGSSPDGSYSGFSGGG